MYYLDLFAGIGGFALGAALAGFEWAGYYYSEVDEYASKVYERRFPRAKALGDIRGIKAGELPVGEWLLSGGFPCQDISSLGKRFGLDGSRSGLWWEYARLIGEVRPRFALVENVSDLAVRGLDRVLGSLAAVGYDAIWQDIRACDVGAPHRRSRIWLVAYPAAPDGSEVPYTHDAWTRGREWGVQSDRQVIPGREDNGSGAARDAFRQWWAPEPGVGRVADGIPDRVDRLKCLGNAVVPQIAYMIAKQVKELV